MAKADAVEVEFNGGERSATRFANSNITANMVQFDRSVAITVHLGNKSGTATVREFDDATLKDGVDDAQKRAGEARDNTEAPLLVGPQDYVPVDAALPSGVNFGPAERGRMVRAEPRHLREEGRARLRLHPQGLSDDLHRQLEGAVRLLPVCGGGLHPDLPHAGRRWLGLGGHHRRQGHRADRSGAPHRDRRRQGAQEPEAARARAGPLHRDPRAAAGGAVPVADDGPVQRPHRRRPGRQLLQRQGARHHQARREAVQRAAHDQERHRQSRSCGRRRSAPTACRRAESPGSRRAC